LGRVALARPPRTRWSYLLALGDLAGAPLDRATEDWVAATPPDRVFDLLVAHKVCEIALERLLASPRVPAALIELLRRRVDRKARSYAETRDLAAAMVRRARDLGGRVMKGGELRGRYPRPELCHVGDIDLQFDRLEQALRFATGLRAEGWEWDRGEVPWMKWDDAGRPYGQWPMRRHLTSEVRLRLDIHQGPYSFGHVGVLPLDEWEPGEVDGVEVEVPSHRMAIALFAAHSAGAAHATVKEANEIGLLAPTAADWRWAEDRCRAAGAGEALAVLRQLVEGRPALTAGAQPPAPLRRWRPEPPGRAAKAWAMAAMTCRQQAVQAPGASWYYLSDVRPRPARAALPASPLARRNRWTCWRLVPPGVWTEWAGGAWPERTPGPAADVEFLPAGGGWLARVGGDVLLPTISGRVPRSVVAAARDLQGAAR
jgi:Uncharacterised nucleotidyltransferase